MWWSTPAHSMTLGDRVDDMDARLARRQEDLIRSFAAMEQAMAVAQNQSAWIAS